MSGCISPHEHVLLLSLKLEAARTALARVYSLRHSSLHGYTFRLPPVYRTANGLYPSAGSQKSEAIQGFKYVT